MLNAHAKIVEDLNELNNGDYFTKQAHFLFDCPIVGVCPNSRHESAVKFYSNFYYQNQEYFSHYFKYIYRLIKFVDDSTLDEKEKFFYSKVIRSQLKQNEAFLLYYNAHTDYGSNFRSLILNYNMLKHLPSTCKIEYNVFKHTDAIVEANRLKYSEWLFGLLCIFINDMKRNKYELLSEEVQSKSVINESFGAIFELKAGEPDEIELTIHYNNDSTCLESYLDISVPTFIEFQYFLIYDFFIHSLFRIDQLTIKHLEDVKKMTFKVSIEHGFEISMDRY